jgi:hypothetical protein
VSESPRYAIYWAPDADHTLWQAGCEWLGRDPESGWTAERLREHVGEPLRYGFHATLKAPMRLRDGVSEQDLFVAAQRLAASKASFTMPPLEVTTLRGFVALRLIGAIGVAHPLRQLADACVRELDALRRPPTEDELARRLQSMDFDATERASIEAFGYPFVFDRWQFHVTLSDSFSDADSSQRDRMLAEARRHFSAALEAPLRCTALSVFVEEAPRKPFRLLRRLPLAA